VTTIQTLTANAQDADLVETSRRRPILAALGLASVIGALMQTLVLPLLPRFPEWLEVSPAAAGWIATSTMLVGAISAPIVGWLGDRFGYKRMIVLLLILLALGSAISASSHSLWQMLLGRTLQGGATGIVGLAIAILREGWDMRSLPISVGILSGTIGIGTSLGVPLSGVIVMSLPWQAVFWISGAGALVALAAIVLVVPARPSRSKRRFDLTGALGLSATLLLFLLPLSGAVPVSLGTHIGKACLLVAILLGVSWLRHEMRCAHPLVDPKAMRRLAVGGSHIIALLLGFAFFLSFTGTITVVQTAAAAGAGLGGSVLLTGLVQMPASLVSIAAPALAGVLAARTSAHTAVVTGIVVALAAFGLRCLSLDQPIPIASSAMLVSGGISFAFAALPNILLADTVLNQTGSANGVNMLFRQVGAATASVTGVAILASAGGPIERLGATPFYWLFGLGAVACLLALIVLFFMSSRFADTNSEMIK
jgi:MFS family permease